MNIEELKLKTIDELKVIAYDILAQLEGLQQSSKIINQLIADKSQEKTQEKPKDVKTNK